MRLLNAFLYDITKKRRAEAEVAYNDISDSALFCYYLAMLFAAAHTDIVLLRSDSLRSLLDSYSPSLVHVGSL